MRERGDVLGVHRNGICIYVKGARRLGCCFIIMVVMVCISCPWDASEHEAIHTSGDSSLEYPYILSSSTEILSSISLQMHRSRRRF